LAKQHIALVDVLIKRTQDGPLIAKLQGVVAIPAWGWWIGTGFFCDDISAAYWRLARTLMAIAVAIFIAVGTMAWFMTRSVTRALGGEPADAAAFAAQIAAGNLAADIRVSPSDRSSLLYALSEMRLKLRDLVQGISKPAIPLRPVQERSRKVTPIFRNARRSKRPRSRKRRRAWSN
jgi:methyl-accepting chemotaxis protein